MFEALFGPLEQVAYGARLEREFLQAILIAREVQQVVDQLHQALHFFVDGSDQVRFTGLHREMQALAQQAESHMHAGHWCAQFMRSAQDELAAYSLEGALLGNVMQHHYRTQDVAFGLADRG
ncbi:hypothetical protein D9M73_272930 [compost metagenome]